MRILAVRGKNLASLPEFDVVFDDGADAPGHLVAIVGPTGAGKSTLLDAVCLALYDRAPRLLGAKEVAFDENEASGQDPRAIMRRGASEATAEVDFVARDNESYRATWETWRAYRRADGRLQPQRMALFHLASESELTGATKTETLASIHDLVGLSFDEFRRAVLLAQGDFSAFLGARGDERAELLEKMTGTHVYGEISRRAFERSRKEDEALARLERDVASLSVLSDEARSEMAEEVESLRRERAEADVQLESAKTALQWHETDDALHKEAEEARLLYSEAEAEEAAARPEAEALMLQDHAEKLRPAFEKAHDLIEEHDAQRDALEQAEEAAREAEAAHRSASEHETEAADDLSNIESKAKESEGRLAEAKRLDGMLEAAALELARSKDEGERLRALGQNAQERFDAKTKAHALAAHRHEELARWINAHPVEARIAASWARWADELDRLSGATKNLEDVEARLTGMETELAQAAEASRRAEQEADQALREEEACERARKEREEISHRLRTESAGPDLRRALERTAEERAALDVMERAARSVRRHHRKKNEEARHEARERELALEAERRLTVITERRKNVASSLEAATRALSALKTRLDLASRRGELLKNDAPCPLCGALEHPAALDPGPDDAELAGLTAAVRSLADDFEIIRAEEQAKAAAVEEHRRAAAEAERRKNDYERTADEDVQVFRARRNSLSMLWIESSVLARLGVGRIAGMLPESPRRTASNPEVEAAREALDAMRSDLLRQAETIEAAALALEQAAGRAHSARTKRERAEEAKRAAQAGLEGLSRARAEAILEQRRLAEERGLIIGRLREALQGYPDLDRLDTEPNAFRVEAEKRVTHFVTLEQEAKLLDEAVHQAAREGEVARAEVDARQEALEAAQSRQKEREAHHADLDQQRKALFDGRTAAEVEQALSDELRAARDRRESTRRERELRSEHWAELRTRLESARQREAELQRERVKAETELSQKLEASPVQDEAQLRTALVHDPDARRAWAERLDAIAKRVEKTRATLADRQRRLEGHREGGSPDITKDEASERIRAFRETLFNLTDRLAALQVQHAQDEEARKKARELVAQFTTQHERARMWAELSSLIGSADGRKFRTFAQSFTLEILLEQANLHLDELRPRYRLRRVPDRDMDLFVEDRDLGEEPRPISTLSGGERFLVSLALALGLSSLSSRTVRLDSLFIDEGFGALDRDSLETALAVLDQLQAEGRTVGLISHVADLAERVVDRVEIRPISPGTSEVRVVSGV